MSPAWLYRSRCCEWHICCGSKKEKEKQNVTGAPLFAAACSGSGIGAGDTDRLNKLIRRARSSLRPFVEVVERRKLNKLLSIIDNPQYLLRLLLVDGQRSSFSSRRPELNIVSHCSALLVLHNNISHTIVCVRIVTCMHTFIPFLPFYCYFKLVYYGCSVYK